jgi:apolipoprotein D and lipocalin family protein
LLYSAHDHLFRFRMNSRLPRLLALGAGLLAIAALARAAGDGGAPLQTIPSLDLHRYLGTWYEIAKYPNRFQRQCAGDTTAQYTLLPDNAIEVRNRCRRADGSLDEAVGAARLNGGPGSAKLKVRFAPAWLSPLPFVWADYWVIDLDPSYQLAAVSEPRREYLWILARTPAVDPQAYAALVERLARQGFDPGRLELTPQH